MEREELLTKMMECRAALLQAIAELSEEEMTKVQVEGTWTIKDLLGHLASWDETMLKPLQNYAAGEGFEVTVLENFLVWNDEQAAQKRDLPLDKIREQFIQVREELVTVAKHLSDEQLNQQIVFSWGGKGTVAKGLWGLCEHEWEHIHTIQKWREGRK